MKKKSNFISYSQFKLTPSVKIALITLYKKYGKNCLSLIDNMTSCDTQSKYEMKKYIIDKYSLNI